MNFSSDDDENEDDVELNQIEFVETICTEKSKLKKEYGKERGLNPVPSEAQQRAIEKLAVKITYREPKSAEVNEDSNETFDILSKPRVILYEGKVFKKSYHSMMQHSSKKHLFLLNDVILISTMQAPNMLSFATEKYCISKVIPLDSISFSDLSWQNKDENMCAFEIATEDRPYQFVAESESDKRIWLEEIHSAVFCIKVNSKVFSPPGWNHEIYRGTIHSAAFFGDLDLMRYHVQRLNGDSVDIPDDNGMHPIHWAALKGHLEICEILIENHTNIDQLNDGLNSPLMIAASQGHDQIVSRLLELGADLNVRNIKDRDALYMAVLYADSSSSLFNILQAFTFRGVDLNEVDTSGSTPLHECASRNLPKSIQFLVDAGADVNKRHERNGLTPLQIACSIDTPDVETIVTLLNKGAHPNWKDTSGRSAFDAVLLSFTARMNKEKALAEMGNNGQNNKSTVDEVSSFVEHALPVLMAIVKKGGKYSEKILLSLRPSFRDAINSAKTHWEKLEQPEFFEDFVLARGEENLTAYEWTLDSSSKHCLMCLDKFTRFSNRRHHCRSCGILCCDSCSSKRLKIIAKSSPNNIRQRRKSRAFSISEGVRFSISSTSPSPVKKNGVVSPGGTGSTSAASDATRSGQRVCDSCFNFLLNESQIRQRNVLKAQKTVDADREKDKDKDVDEVGKAELIQEEGGTSSPGSRARSQTSSKKLYVGELQATAEALEQRGQLLESTAEKSDLLKEAAEEYNQMAKKLLRQQQQQQFGYKSSKTKQKF